MPYRSRKQERRTTSDTGFVGEMVRQFADPYAFVRELVQNSIDAGASALTVRVELAEQVRISVRDDGSGMTRALIEGALLTLFSSSKENDQSKIGKYGIGFVSVLAIEPELVTVETWRDGQAWRVSLAPDHSYEIGALGPRSGHGTVVTLHKAGDREAFSSHVAETRNALVRWCRHALVPITFQVAQGAGERIDRPLALTAPVTITHARGDDRYVLAAGVLDDAPGEASLERPASFAGFYNRGLMLEERTEPPSPKLAGVRFKVMSPTLQHTVSRDGVRRGPERERILAEVEQLAARVLAPELRQALAEQAARAAHSGDFARYAALLDPALRGALAQSESDIAVPIADPVGGRRVMMLDELRAIFSYARAVRHAPRPSGVTAALAELHEPVWYAGHPLVLELLKPRLTRPFEGNPLQLPLVAVDEQFLLLSELRGKLGREADTALCEQARAALRALDVEVGDVRIAAAEGRITSYLVYPVDPWAPGHHHLCRPETRPRWRRRFGRNDQVLLLLANHPLVAGARTLAEYDPVVAGHLLARALLLDESGAIGAGASEALLAACVTARRRWRKRKQAGVADRITRQRQRKRKKEHDGRRAR